uniref:MARVEL domain-containing protein n=1 Tax=Romanomermis culicivorax TaxID=13658 RepID=A0A915HQS0_ROMCU
MPISVAYFNTRTGQWRIVELIIAIIIAVLMGTLVPALGSTHEKWYNFLSIGILVCFILICISVVLNLLGQGCPCEFWFCIFAAIVYIGFGATGIYVATQHRNTDIPLIAAIVLSLVNGVLFLTDLNTVRYVAIN